MPASRRLYPLAGVWVETLPRLSSKCELFFANYFIRMD